MQLIAYAESNSDSVTTSTSLQDKVTVNVTAGQLVAGAVVEVWAYGECQASVAGNRVVFKLENITDSVVLQDLAPALALSTYNDNIGQVAQGFYTVPGTPVDVTFKLRFASSVSGNEVKLKNAHVVVVTAGANDYRAESTGKTDNTTTYQDVATITQTVSGRHIVLATLEDVNGAGDRPYARVNIDSTLALAAEIVDTPTGSSRNSLTIGWVSDDMASASHSFALGTRDTSTSSDAYNKRIIARKAADTLGYWYNQQATNDTTPATSFESKASVTQTWASGVAYLVIATIPARTSNTSSVDLITELRVGGSAVRTCKTRPRNTFGIECTDSMCISYILVGDGTSKTVEGGWYLSSSASGNCSGASVIVIQLQSSGAVLPVAGYAMSLAAAAGGAKRTAAGRGTTEATSRSAGAITGKRAGGGTATTTSTASGAAAGRQGTAGQSAGQSTAAGQPSLSAALLAAGHTQGIAIAAAQPRRILAGSTTSVGLASLQGKNTQSKAGRGFASAGSTVPAQPARSLSGSAFTPGSAIGVGTPSIPAAIVGAAGWAIAESRAFAGPATARAGHGHTAGQSAGTSAPGAVFRPSGQAWSHSSAAGRGRTVLAGSWSTAGASGAIGQASILGTLQASGYAIAESFAIGQGAIATITIAPSLPAPATHQISKRVLDALRARLIVAWDASVRAAAAGYDVPAADVERIATMDWTGLQRKQVWIGQVDPAAIGGSSVVTYPAASIAISGTQHLGIEKFREWSGDVTAQIAIALTWRKASAVPEFDEQADLVQDAMYAALYDRGWLSAAGHGMTFANAIEARGPVEAGSQHWLQVLLFQFTFEVDV